MRRRGGTSLEFGLILPVFVLLVGGIMDVAWLFYMENALDRAVMLGCRAGALVDPGVGEASLALTKAKAEDVMEEALWMNATGLTAVPESLTTTVTTHGTSPGRSLVCEVNVEFRPLVGIVLDPLTLSSSTAIRLEWQRG